MYVSRINLTYYNLHGGITRGKYYMHITLHCLYVHLTMILMSSGIMCQHNYECMH